MTPSSQFREPGGRRTPCRRWGASPAVSARIKAPEALVLYGCAAQGRANCRAHVHQRRGEAPSDGLPSAGVLCRRRPRESPPPFNLCQSWPLRAAPWLTSARPEQTGRWAAGDPARTRRSLTTPFENSRDSRSSRGSTIVAVDPRGVLVFSNPSCPVQPGRHSEIAII
jgi:hypothetical protein